MKPLLGLAAILSGLGFLCPLHAQVPQIINYQGRVVTNGVNFTGTGQFRFALVDAAGTTTYWSNDGTSVGGGQPTAAVSLGVSNGLYSVLLGWAGLPNMTSIPHSVFTNSSVYLRVWFDDGTSGVQQLSPDQRIVAVGYAMMAANVPDGIITSNKLAAGAVTTAKIADGAITAAKLASNSVTSVQLGDVISLGDSNAVTGQLDIFRTGVGTPALSLRGSDSRLSAYGSSDGLERVRLYGPSWGQLLLYDNVGNDLTVDLRANNNSGGSLYLYHSNNSARAYLAASSTAGDLYLYSTNGATRSRLHGGSDGSYLSLYNAAGSTTLYLDGDDSGGGSVGVRNTNGSARVYIDGQGNSGGGQINVYTGDGDLAAILYGDVSGGAQMYLYNTNGGMRLWLDGYGADGGGQIKIRANDGSDTINLQGDSGGGGLVAVNNTNGAARAELDGQGSYGGGELRLYDSSGSTGVAIQGAYGSSFGGYMTLYQADGSAGVRLYSEMYANDGGQISIYTRTGDEHLELDGDDGDGGAAIRLRNTNGTTTITLDGHYGTAGDGKITCDILQIMGGSDLSEQFDVSAPGQSVEPGMVVCIDPQQPGQLVPSRRAYDRTVAGVISGAGGVRPGMLMGQAGTKADGKHPVALTGRVYCLADASNGAIRPGDLLTTSDTPGHAMKVTDPARAQGAILGKAMTGLDSGRGLVLVLVSLQ